MRLIVTGAAGRLGRLVAEQLLERVAPKDLILVTRHPEALHEFGARGADVRYGDFDFPETLPEAFAGGHRMLLIGTDAIGRRIWQHRAAIDAAAGAGVDHLVFTSHGNPLGNPQGSFAQELAETEAILQHSRRAWTVLRFHTFAELRLPPSATAVQDGRLIGNGGGGRVAPVSYRDCAEAVAVALTTDGHTGQTYNITGSGAFSPRELAEPYADVTGPPLKLVQLSDWMLTSVLVAIGTPWPSAPAIAAFGRAVREGYFDVVDLVYECLAGHPPASLPEPLIAQRSDLLAMA